MQQRGVIITAIVLALILAGGLWFTVNRSTAPTATSTPSPTPQVFEIPPQQLVGDPRIPAADVSGTQTDVAPSAPSGTNENIIIATFLVSLVALSYLVRVFR